MKQALWPVTAVTTTATGSAWSMPFIAGVLPAMLLNITSQHGVVLEPALFLLVSIAIGAIGTRTFILNKPVDISDALGEIRARLQHRDARVVVYDERSISVYTPGEVYCVMIHAEEAPAFSKPLGASGRPVHHETFPRGAFRVLATALLLPPLAIAFGFFDLHALADPAEPARNIMRILLAAGSTLALACVCWIRAAGHNMQRHWQQKMSD